MPRITISMACWGRPQRTQRAIMSILAQSVYDFEAFVLGDGCPVFKPVTYDNRFISFNMEHTGGYGFEQTNYAIEHATAPYICFMGNDDVLAGNHFATRLSEIENTDLDFVYFDIWMLRELHIPKLKYGKIGDGHMIYRTESLRQIGPWGPEYGNDWDAIHDVMLTGGKYKKSNLPATYYCMGNPDNRTDPEGID
jgi:glycosyltransferase involved in cell wall biosynthesis